MSKTKNYVLASENASKLAHQARTQGVIKFIDRARAFGVISFKGEKTWVALRELEKGGLADAGPGTPVSFRLVYEGDGKSQAIAVERG